MPRWMFSDWLFQRSQAVKHSQATMMNNWCRWSPPMWIVLWRFRLDHKFSPCSTRVGKGAVTEYICIMPYVCIYIYTYIDMDVDMCPFGCSIYLVSLLTLVWWSFETPWNDFATRTVAQWVRKRRCRAVRTEQLKGEVSERAVERTNVTIGLLRLTVPIMWPCWWKEMVPENPWALRRCRKCSFDRTSSKISKPIWEAVMNFGRWAPDPSGRCLVVTLFLSRKMCVCVHTTSRPRFVT